MKPARIGTAGWSVPRSVPGEGSHLQRYAKVMRAAEINSSFYRPHAGAVYAKWAKSTPRDFTFAVKMPGTITHDLRLRQPVKLAPLIRQFVHETSGLGRKLGPMLVQLPPSLEFNPGIVNRFFTMLRSLFPGRVVCEPRHVTWFSSKASDLLMQHKVARVAADPARAPGADTPGGWPGIVYYRLHGSPRTYWSSYDARYLDALAASLRRLPSSTETWVIFDNTASGAAFQNALQTTCRLPRGRVGNDVPPGKR